MIPEGERPLAVWAELPLAEKIVESQLKILSKVGMRYNRADGRASARDL